MTEDKHLAEWRAEIRQQTIEEVAERLEREALDCRVLLHQMTDKATFEAVDLDLRAGWLLAAARRVRNILADSEPVTIPKSDQPEKAPPSRS